MKKVIAILLCAAMAAAMFAGCGKTDGGSTDASKVTLTLEEILEKMTTEVPVEFAAGTTILDLNDTSEEGKWALKSYTGLDNADDILEALAFEPMMGSMAYSLVLVRVAQGKDAKAVAQAMQSGIDPRKWICVEADDMMLAGSGDIVMLSMVSSGSELTAQSYVDAFAKAVGADPDFTLQ